MALQLNDRVKESSITTGVAPIVLTGSPTGYQNVASSISTSNTFPYVVELVGGSEWEIGVGQYVSSNNSIIRTQILNSSNSSNIVNFSAGTKNVFISVPAAYIALTASGLSQFATTTSAELASIISDTTGTGNLVFANNAVFVTPTIGIANGTSLNLTTAISSNLSLVGPSLSANLTRFPNALAVVSNTAVSLQQNETHNIGLIAEGVANASNTSIYGIGVYGVGYTNAGTRSGGVVGEGHVTSSSDGGSAIGVRGYAHDIHAGGLNVGLYGDATNGSANYALAMNNGDILSNFVQTWYLNGGLTFTGGANTVTIPNLVSSNVYFSSANGTQPFTVVSNTLVSNLNSDLLDGQHGTYYTGLTGTAFGQANTGVAIGQAAYTQANTAVTVAQAAFNAANTETIGQAAFGQANTAFTAANTGVTVAQAAFNAANTETIGQAAFGQANTGVTVAQAAFNAANTETIGQAAFGQANAAFTQANTGVTVAQAALNAANTETIGQAAFGQANAAFTQANTGVTVAQAAFAAANTETIGQAAFGQANTGVTVAQAAFAAANTGISVGQGAFAQANSEPVGKNAFAAANTGISVGQGAFAQANSEPVGKNAFAQANSAYNTANTKFSANGGTISGSVTITTDLSITGNIYLGGNVTTLSSNNLVIDDSLIYLAQNNPANLQDIGFVGHFTSGTYQHTGFVRDATDGVWKLFSNVAAEPTTTMDFTGAIYDVLQVGTVNSSNANFSAAQGTTPFTVVSNTIVSNLNSDFFDGQHGTYYTGLTGSAWSTANTGVTIGQAAFARANTETIGQAAFTQANTGVTIAQAGFGVANTGVTIATSSFGVANTGVTIATAGFTQANTGFTQANTGVTIGQAAFTQANTGVTIATSSFGVANTGVTIATAGFGVANTGVTIGQAAFARANTETIGQAAFTQANTGVTIAQAAFSRANTETIGQAAFGVANTGVTIGQAAFARANTETIGQAAFTQANTGVTIGQAAFTQANTKFSSSGGTITGNTAVIGVVTGNTFVSTIAIGTAPLTVSSTTVVTNLNADYLDGQHGAYYTTAGNLSGTIPSAVLGNSTLYIGTTAVTLNRASASLALTGISSISGSAASVTNAVTFNNGGIGDITGTTFNGSVARTISYNSVGASPLAGSSSITTTGTVTSGTWSGLFGAVSGANLTGLTAGNLSGTIPSAVLGNSTHYIGTTAVTLNRASASLALTGISSISGTSAGITGGAANQIHYQTGSSTTSFIAAPTTASTFLQWNGSAFAWATVSAGATLADDTTTNASYYLGMSTTTSGSWTAAKVSSTKLYFNPSTGTLNSTIYNSLSDESVKTNISVISDSLSIIDKINGVEFNWIDNNKPSAGVIAQQLETVLPALVDTSESGLKSVNYLGIIGYLIEAIKELNSEINELKTMIK
jgi:hypothetical protein